VAGQEVLTAKANGLDYDVEVRFKEIRDRYESVGIELVSKILTVIPMAVSPRACPSPTP
jgi:hypothetical protein